MGMCVNVIVKALCLIVHAIAGVVACCPMQFRRHVKDAECIYVMVADMIATRKSIPTIKHTTVNPAGGLIQP